MGTPADFLFLPKKRLPPAPPQDLYRWDLSQPGRSLLPTNERQQLPAISADLIRQRFLLAFLLRKAEILHSHLIAVIPLDGCMGFDPFWHHGRQTIQGRA